MSKKGKWRLNPLGETVCNKCNACNISLHKNYCPCCGRKMKLTNKPMKQNKKI